MNARDELELDWLDGEVGDLRSLYERACRIADLEGCAWIEIGAAERQLRVLAHEPMRPAVRDCAIIYFHGGGWIVGSPATHADISGALCERTGLRVFSVDYRLAPESKAPAAIEDGVMALEFFLADERGRDRLSSAFLCGDSAGGAIAMAVGRFSRPPLRGKIAGICSFYGGFGLIDSRSMRLYGNREQGLDQECIKRYWSLANESDGISPYSISALQSGSSVPVYLMACGRDPVRDDSLMLARALREKDQDVTVDLVKSAAHGFLHEGTRSTLAGDALKRVAGWIEEQRIRWRPSVHEQ